MEKHTLFIPCAKLIPVAQISNYQHQTNNQAFWLENRAMVNPIPLMASAMNRLVHSGSICGLASPKAVITSAYQDYALDGYELDVLDYLIKPIPFDRFLKAVGKLSTHRPVVAVPAPVPAEEPFIFVKEDRRLIRLLLRDIIWLESLRDYVKIRTTTQEIVTRQTISYYEELLPNEQFIRIHRSFMVAVAQIRVITETQLEVSGQTLTIGRNYKQQVFERLQVRSLLR